MKTTVTFTKLSGTLLILALSTLGVVYGQWMDILSIQGTVTTGEVDAAWTASGCYDEEPYATISRSLLDSDTIQVTLDKAYPGYTGHCWAEFTVGGTLPVRIEQISFDHGSNLSDCSVSYEDGGTGSFTASCDQIQIVWSDGLCTLLNPGSRKGTNMHVSVLGGADQDTSYTFSIHYTLEQENTSSCIP